MAGTDPYDRVTEGVSTGLKFALEQRKLDNEEASINERLEAARIAKNGHSIDVFSKLADFGEKVGKFNPKMQSAAWKAAAPQIDSLLGPGTANNLALAQLTDPSVVKDMSDYSQALKLKMTEKDTDATAEPLLAKLGTYEFNAFVKQEKDRLGKIEAARLVSTDKNAIRDQNAKDALERAKIMAAGKANTQGRLEKKDEFGMVKQTKEGFDKSIKFQNDIDNQVFGRTARLFNKPVEKFTPVDKLDLIKAFQQATEVSSNAVREGEVTMSQGLQTKVQEYQQRFGSITNQKDAAVLSSNVAKGMIDVLKEIKISNQAAIDERVAQAKSTINDFGLQKFEQSILGRFSKKQIAQNEVKKAKTSKESLKLDDEKLRAGIVSRYRGLGITPTENQIQTKMKLYKSKIGAK